MSVVPHLLRPAWFEIDLDAVAENLRSVRRLVGAGRRIFAVVKAGGYGFGTLEMAEVFAVHGADALAFADLGDAIWARRQGVSLPILVFPSALPGAAPEVIAHGLIPTLTDLDQARAYAAAARGPCEVFVKVDAGLQRLGVAAEQAVEVIKAIARLSPLRLGGVCTHLHAPPGADPAYINWQFGRFTSVLEGLAGAGVEVPVRLAASSPLVMQHRHTYLNAVDPGSMLYGVPQSFATPPGVPLRPAFRALKARLISVKEVAPRERFAAEAPFPVPAPVRLGVIPLGTADGLGRLHDGRVLVRGRAVPILASPSLEHTRVDLTAVPDARVGDEVVVIGRQGDAEITPAAVAARHGLAPLQIALAVGERVARVYCSGERAVLVRTRLGTAAGEPRTGDATTPTGRVATASSTGSSRKPKRRTQSRVRKIGRP